MKAIYDLTGGASRHIDLENAGRQLRFVYLGEIPAEEQQALGSLPFLGGHRRGTLSDYMVRVEGGEKLAVLDYAYGRGARRLVYFEPDHLVWPGALDAFLGRATRIFDLFRH
jgi:hypothetical protein